MERQLAERLTIARLIDAYGGLLTARQLGLLRRYYLDDFSLSEIAGQMKITRQAVFDSLRRSVEELNRLEGALHLVAAADHQSAQKTQIATRLEALQRFVATLDGRVDEKILRKITGRLTALRRACL